MVAEPPDVVVAGVGVEVPALDAVPVILSVYEPDDVPL
jgi:hypothetical protein